MKRGTGSVPDELKVPKEAAGYLPPLPRGLSAGWRRGRICSTCYFGCFLLAQPQGSCFVVKGAIHRESVCLLWNATGTLHFAHEAPEQLAVRLRVLEPFLTRVHRR